MIAPETLLSYLNSLVIPELQQTQKIDDLPLIKATCIKFIYFFRNQLLDEQVQPLLALMTEYLRSDYPVNQSYAAACIEKLLVKKRKEGDGPVLTDQTVDQALLSKLLQNLCELLSKSQDLYAVRALLRVIQLSKQILINFAAPLGSVLGSFITNLVKDQTLQPSPNYVYILFESAAISLTYVKSDKQAFQTIEQHITPALNLIIQSGNSEYSSYAFQLYATFVASADQLSDNYMMLASSIMTESNWQKDLKYLIPALTTFLITIIAKHPQYA